VRTRQRARSDGDADAAAGSGRGLRVAAREHRVDATQIHHEWDRSLDPALTVRSGDVVTFDCPLGGDPALREGSTAEVIDLERFQFNLAGPVYIEGAQPGDTVQVDILDVRPGEWGYTIVVPGMGLLPDDFPDLYLKTWNLRQPSGAELVPGVTVPLAPFLGTLGTHPGAPQRVGAFPPHRGGGNLDNRHLVRSTSLWVPIWCEGALFSCGDGHAAQGDGEICVSAIECAMEATLRLTLHGRSIPGPRFVAPQPASEPLGRYQGTMGISSDLFAGAQEAARAMIEWLVDERSLSPEDAYVLCSVAADLHIHEIVDDGVWNVGMTIPLSIFD
jgi:acetamidase/formamidase